MRHHPGHCFIVEAVPVATLNRAIASGLEPCRAVGGTDAEAKEREKLREQKHAKEERNFKGSQNAP